MHSTQNPQCLFVQGLHLSNVPLSLSANASFAKVRHRHLSSLMCQSFVNPKCAQTIMGPVCALALVEHSDKVVAGTTDGKIVRVALFA